MGCSSSARTRSPEQPPAAAAGPPPREASSGQTTPTADDHETIADQTQLDPAEDVSLASEETNPGEHLPEEEAAAVIESVCKREEPEGTEPSPAGVEEISELLSALPEERTGTSPREDTGSPSPGPAEDSGLVEGSGSSVVETTENVHITEEDLTEGETGEQMEAVLLSEIVSGGPETKEET